MHRPAKTRGGMGRDRGGGGGGAGPALGGERCGSRAGGRYGGTGGERGEGPARPFGRERPPQGCVPPRDAVRPRASLRRPLRPEGAAPAPGGGQGMLPLRESGLAAERGPASTEGAAGRAGFRSSCRIHVVRCTSEVHW